MSEAEAGNAIGEVYDRDHLPPGFTSVESWYGACRHRGLSRAIYQPARGFGWRVPASVWAQSRHSKPDPAVAPPLPADAVEAALAAALAGATAAGQWGVVAQLATELQARRLEAAGVATLPARAKG